MNDGLESGFQTHFDGGGPINPDHYEEEHQVSMQNNTRVQKHRTQMAAEGCARVEVTLGAWLIAKARESARKSGWPLWAVVHEALIAHLKTGSPGETGNGKS